MIMPREHDASLLASLTMMRRSFFMLLAALLTLVTGVVSILSAFFTLAMGVAAFLLWALSVGRLYLDSALLWVMLQAEMRYTI